MGELQHGIYDDDWDDFKYEEINILHGFSEKGDVIDEDQTDDGDLNELSDSNSDGNSYVNYAESGASEDLISESCDSDMKVHFLIRN